ncbi:MAG: hypothetical protein ACTHNW_16760 [Mucilaginibacter sp.]
MDNLNELKQIWLTADTRGLPPASQMEALVKKYSDQKILKTVLTIVAGIICLCAIIVVAFTYNSSMLSTRIGEVMIGAAGLVLLSNSFSLLISFYKLKDCSNRDYLQHMEHIKQKQLFFFKRTQLTGFLLASVGTMVYMFEYVSTQGITGLMEYGALLLYMAIAWFVLRPKVMNRHTRKINEQIERLKELEKQLNKDEQ